MRCLPVSPIFASWPWLVHTGCSLEALDMTVHDGIIRGDTVGISTVTFYTFADTLSSVRPRKNWVVSLIFLDEVVKL